MLSLSSQHILTTLALLLGQLMDFAVAFVPTKVRTVTFETWDQNSATGSLEGFPVAAIAVRFIKQPSFSSFTEDFDFLNYPMVSHQTIKEDVLLVESLDSSSDLA